MSHSIFVTTAENGRREMMHSGFPGVSHLHPKTLCPRLRLDPAPSILASYSFPYCSHLVLIHETPPRYDPRPILAELANVRLANLFLVDYLFQLLSTPFAYMAICFHPGTLEQFPVPFLQIFLPRSSLVRLYRKLVGCGGRGF